MFGWAFKKCVFKLYFATAGADFGHIGQCSGTFEQGDDVDDLAATLYEKVNFTGHPDERLWSILGLPPAPFPFVKKNWHNGTGRRQRKQGSLV